jgi:hypothetical protein
VYYRNIIGLLSHVILIYNNFHSIAIRKIKLQVRLFSDKIIVAKETVWEGGLNG